MFLKSLANFRGKLLFQCGFMLSIILVIFGLGKES